MPEMPRAGNTMAMLCLSAASITFLSRIGSARLNDRRCAGLDCDQKTIGEREERIGRDHRTFGQRTFELHLFRGIFRLARGDACGIDAAHLAGADADGGDDP